MTIVFETQGFTCEWEGGHVPLPAGEITLRQPGTCWCGAIGDNVAPEPSRDDSQHGQDTRAFKHPNLKIKQVKFSVSLEDLSESLHCWSIVTSFNCLLMEQYFNKNHLFLLARFPVPSHECCQKSLAAGSLSSYSGRVQRLIGINEV